MLENIVEFFRNLPSKKCAKCGKELSEQSECYVTECDKCEGK